MSQHKQMVNLCVSVYKLNRIMTDYTQRLIESEGIKDLQPSANVILIPLIEREGQTLSELARNIHMKAPTITVIANRLEDRGLIRRERGSTDRRQVHLYLTRQGREMAEKLEAIQARLVQQMADGINRSTLSDAGETLNRVIDNVFDKVS